MEWQSKSLKSAGKGKSNMRGYTRPKRWYLLLSYVTNEAYTNNSIRSYIRNNGYIN